MPESTQQGSVGLDQCATTVHLTNCVNWFKARTVISAWGSGISMVDGLAPCAHSKCCPRGWNGRSFGRLAISEERVSQDYRLACLTEGFL